MDVHHDLARRRVLKAIAAGALGSALPTLAGCAEATVLDRRLQYASLDEALREIERLAGAPRLRSEAAWSFPQTLVHCAQSIEYSIRGFPQAKSALFQKTVGGAAFNVFSWRGRMSHDLAEPIPGAPALEPDTPLDAARLRLDASIRSFRAAGALQPHFAYGELTKAEYERAHAMHLANHLSAFDVETLPRDASI